MPRRPPAPPPKGSFPGIRHQHAPKSAAAKVVLRAVKKSDLTDPTVGGYAMLPRAAILDRGLSAEDLRVLALLCVFRNAKTGQCNPAVARLAAILDRHRSKVHLRLRRLEKNGHIRIETKGARSGYIVLYRPTDDDVPPAVDCVDESPAPDTSCSRSRYTSVAIAATPLSRLRLQGTESRTDFRTERPAHSVQPVMILPLNGGLADVGRGVPGPSPHERYQDGAASGAKTSGANALARALGRCVEWLSATTGQHAGQITAEVSQWHDDLQRAGLADDAAQQAIVDICNTAKAAGHNIRDVRGAVAARVAQLEDVA